MLFPGHDAGIEESGNLAGHWIWCSDVTALEPIALGAGVCEVVGISSAAVFARNDVIDLMGKRSVIGMYQAILATLQRACDNQRTQTSRNLSYGNALTQMA